MLTTDPILRDDDEAYQHELAVAEERRVRLGEVDERDLTMTAKAENKKLCNGCRDNYYNQPGNSTSGECWMLESSKIVERTMVGVWQNPPYQWTPQKTLDCHHPEGSVWIKDNDCRIEKQKTKATA